MKEGYIEGIMEAAPDALGFFSSSCARWGSLSLNAGFGHSAIVAVRGWYNENFLII